MTELSIIGTGYINNGPGWPCQIMTYVERIDISTNLPKANPKWTFVDSNGHFHAYNQAADRSKGERYPTLRAQVEQLPCDNADHDAECEGAHKTHWHCLICDEEVRPGVIEGPHYDTMPGPMSWEAKVSVPAEQAFPLLTAREKIVLRVESNDRVLFGVGFVSGDYTYTSGDPIITVTVRDAGPLGETKRAA